MLKLTLALMMVY